MAARTADSDAGSMTPSEQSDAEERSDRDSDYETDEEEEHKESMNIQWTGYAKKTPVILFNPDAILQKKAHLKAVGERYHLAYKFGNSECKLVRNIFNFHGFHEVHPNSSDYNIIWTGGHLKPFTLRGMTEFQKINHFPRSYELTRKDRLYKNLQRMQQIKGVKHFDFIPQSFILPGEYQDFCSSFLREKGTWIVKPVASSRGRGVFLCNHPDQVPLDENLIVCRYIHNPLLIDNFKFDVRLYVCVTSYDPLVIYLFEEGLSRFATVKYEKSNRHIRNQCMHLTNYSVNKKSDDYVRNDDPDVEDYGNKWSLGAMLRYLRSHGKDTAAIMMRIEDVIIKTIISVELPVATACKMFMPHRGNCFELYGFDILIDDNLKPWVLEVNLSPSLACDAPLDLKIKTSMLCDMFSLSGLICHDPMMRTLQQSRRNQELASKMAARAKRQRPQSAGASSVMSNTSSRNSDKNSNNNSKAAANVAGLNSDEIKILRRIKEEDSRKGGWVRIFPTPDSWDLYSSFLQFSTTHNLMLHSRLYPERHAGGSTGSQRSTTTSAGSRARSAYSGRSDLECAESYAQAILRTRQYERKLGTARTRGRRNKARLKQRQKQLQKQRAKLVQGVAEEGEEENEDEKDEDDDRQIDEKDVADERGTKDGDSRSSSPDLDDIPEKKTVIEVETEKNEEQPPVGAKSSTSQSSMSSQQEKNSRLPPKPPPASLDILQRENKVEEKVVEREPVIVEAPPPPPPQPPEEKYNVVELLHKGHTLSKVQARAAFAMYLVRVQQRLITETTPMSADDTDALNEQMQVSVRWDLVLRFLKRAAVNLQSSFKVVVPSRKLPLNDRRRILAKQLGDFVHIYNKETEQLRIKKIQERKQGKIAEVFPGQESLCEKKFERFVNIANEGELEEVLTTYTKINKSASIFLGGNNNKAESTSQSRPSTGSATPQGPTAAHSDSSLARRRDSSEPPPPPPQVVSGWEDVPRVNTATAIETKPSAASTLSASQYQTPSQSSYANAVQIYSQKLGGARPSSATTRPRSASSSSQRPGTSHGGGNKPFARPMSAAQSRQLMNNPYATTDPTVDSYNDQAIHEALQRLALRQQARQYSAHNGSTVIPSEEIKSRPSTAQNPRTSDMLHYRSNSIGDNIHNNYSSSTYLPGDKTKFVTMEDHFARSRPPSGSVGRGRTTLLESRSGSAVSRKPVQTNVNLQSANATFNSFIDEPVPQWQSDLAMAYNQVTGVLPNNYHTASQSSKQYQLLQQHQALKHQSKAMLEQSKAKHQAMVAQAHAVQKSIQQHYHPGDPESAVSKYAPKPPVQPSHTRKLSGSHRVQSVKYDNNTGQFMPAQGW